MYFAKQFSSGVFCLTFYLSCILPNGFPQMYFVKQFTSDVCLRPAPNVGGILLWLNLYGNYSPNIYMLISSHLCNLHILMTEVIVKTLAVTVVLMLMTLAVSVMTN